MGDGFGERLVEEEAGVAHRRMPDRARREDDADEVVGLGLSMVLVGAGVALFVNDHTFGDRVASPAWFAAGRCFMGGGSVLCLLVGGMLVADGWRRWRTLVEEERGGSGVMGGPRGGVRGVLARRLVRLAARVLPGLIAGALLAVMGFLCGVKAWVEADSGGDIGFEARVVMTGILFCQGACAVVTFGVGCVVMTRSFRGAGRPPPGSHGAGLGRSVDRAGADRKSVV